MDINYKNTIKKATMRLLKPIVQVLIKNEISHSEFAEFAKEAYVDVANKHFAIPNRKSTYSRVAVLTGLSRKEVLRLTKAEEQPKQTPKLTPNRAARVITGWLTDKDFLDEQQQPKVIPLKAEDNLKTIASFADLVERYSGDISARAILDELTRLKIISRVNTDSVRLEKQGYIPETNDTESIDILSDCAGNLLNTGVFNINQANNKEKKFQRQLTHRDVPPSIAREFKIISQEKSLNLLLELDQWLSHKKTSINAKKDNHVERIGLGIYYFEDKDHEQ